tara:strand:- start:144 stop:275 length:132 start_codon:yes stop_codon:yes gene_type:complete
VLKLYLRQYHNEFLKIKNDSKKSKKELNAALKKIDELSDKTEK